MSVQGDEVELSEGAEEDALSASGPHATDGLDGGGPTGSVSDSTDPRTPTPPSSRSPLPGQTARSPPSSKPRPSQHSRSSPSRRGCVTLPPPPCLLAAQEPSRFWPTSVTLGPWAPVAAPPGPGFLSGVGPNPLPGPTAYTRSLAHTPSSGPQTGLGLSPVPRPLAYSTSFPHTPSSGPQTRLGLIPVPRPVAYSASFPHTASGGLQTRLGLSPVPRPAAYSAWFPPTASCGLQTGLGLSPVPRPAAYTSAYPTTPSATPRPGLRIGAPVATREPPQGPSPDFSDPPSLEGSCSFL
ncbi:extensin-like [Chiloscyllium plagiosum]|uniref:extensin-like n=1 Tax=Chiloscyllium plagiosum TaxID=36176 RepID=UPI001CB8075A|nr:extensin-like [Chiloscyllium plagiosum]